MTKNGQKFAQKTTSDVLDIFVQSPNPTDQYLTLLLMDSDVWQSSG